MGVGMTMLTNDPFLVAGPAALSFSGGRTSGYMLRRVLDAYNGVLPPDIIPIFANTGKEREETLRFVYECESRWGVKVRWIEWRADAPGFEEVGYNMAARQGEPFAALIAKKKITPNWQMRFCTQYLKVQAMTDFVASLGFVGGGYREIIGLRHDEGHRVLKMLERNEKYGRLCVAPLAKAKVTKRDVMDFWKVQPFDLGLESGEGNCDLCFLKGRGLRKELIRRRPASADWWITQEETVNGFFDRRDSYAGLCGEVHKSPDLFEADAEHDVECGLLCASVEVAA
jgi:3'-phosphoadenosine 5'-phosphosulfate sulfotransferase (PAPS reductase)/FAD synthetase